MKKNNNNHYRILKALLLSLYSSLADMTPDKTRPTGLLTNHIYYKRVFTKCNWTLITAFKQYNIQYKW